MIYIETFTSSPSSTKHSKTHHHGRSSRAGSASSRSDGLCHRLMIMSLFVYVVMTVWVISNYSDGLSGLAVTGMKNWNSLQEPLGDLTILTTIRAMTDDDFGPIEESRYSVIHHQKNALRSWVAFMPSQNIITFVDHPSTCIYLRREFPFIRCVVHACTHPEYRLPLLNCILYEARQLVQTDIIAFVNGDILLFDEFPRAVDKIFTEEKLDGFMIGQRLDVETDETLDFSDAKVRMALRQDALQKGELHGDMGVDYFVFRKSFLDRIDVPPFLLGTWRWDNWLVSEALMLEGMHVVDATKVLVAVHQGKKTPYTKTQSHERAGSTYNENLVRSYGLRYRIGRMKNARSRLEANKDGNFSIVINTHTRLEMVIFGHALRLRHDTYVVAVLTVNWGYHELADNWLCWAARINFRNFVLLAQDKKTYRYFRSKNVYNVIVSPDAPEERAAADYGDKAFQETMTFRTNFLGELLDLGVDFLTGDLDAIWMGNPLVELDPSCDLQGQPHKKSKISGGLVAIKSSQQGREFWRAVVQCQQDNMATISKLEPNTYDPSKYTEQECIDDLSMRSDKLRVCLLPEMKFPDGKAFFEDHTPQLYGAWPTVIHNNWIVGVANKVARFKAWGLWAVDEDSKSCILSESIPNHTKVFETLGLEVTSRKQPTLDGQNEHSLPVVKSLPIVPSSQPRWNVAPYSPEGQAYSPLPPGPFNLLLRVLVMNRHKDLQRLLASLNAADYDGDRVALQISIDHPSETAEADVIEGWQKTIQVATSFKWSYGDFSVHKHDSNVGLEGQWIFGWKPKTLGDVILVVEDDIEVSRYFYHWLKKTTNYYYLNASNYDHRLFGIALQNQHAVVGETPKARFGAIDIYQSINAVGKALNTEQHVFLFQQLSTWGSAWFPLQWLEFEAFHRERRNLRVADGELYKPCTPALVTNRWWCQKGRRSLWSIWHIRFAFEKGYFNMYFHFPNDPGKALVTNWKSHGVNFKNLPPKRTHELIDYPPPSDPSSYFPPIRSLRVRDFHFNEIMVDPSVLSFRKHLHTHLGLNMTCHYIDARNKQC
mmetsp:Transcript_36480/g.60728  ORF Transcript_36480/g.60728 Transcript_36480/m.60728 type:complete len:1051 (+) Transcript_36480:256-3408(+)